VQLHNIPTTDGAFGMTSKLDRARNAAKDRAAAKPAWADGLQKLYDSVVDEPLPDAFEELLRKLDQSDDS
jgi:Anti-sigma factor NepR